MNLLWRVVERWPKVGLAKFAMKNESGVCAMGILNLIQNGDAHCNLIDHERMTAMRLMSEVGVEQFPDRADWDAGATTIVLINNHQDTTLSDMVAIAEKAAIKWDEAV